MSKGRGIYVLDEPEAALSPQRQLAFLKVIHDLDVTGQAQFLIASHSPILLAYPKATLFSLDGGPIHEVMYTDTEHYKLTKAFLDSPERFLKHLFESSNDEDQRPRSERACTAPTLARQPSPPKRFRVPSRIASEHWSR